MSRYPSTLNGKASFSRKVDFIEKIDVCGKKKIEETLWLRSPNIGMRSTLAHEYGAEELDRENTTSRDGGKTIQAELKREPVIGAEHRNVNVCVTEESQPPL